MLITVIITYLKHSTVSFCVGEELILKQNLFVELLFPRSVIREMSDEEMDVYREPFEQEGESRRPTLTWPRQIPVASDGIIVILLCLNQCSRLFHAFAHSSNLIFNKPIGAVYMIVKFVIFYL